MPRRIPKVGARICEEMLLRVSRQGAEPVSGKRPDLLEGAGAVAEVQPLHSPPDPHINGKYRHVTEPKQEDAVSDFLPDSGDAA